MIWADSSLGLFLQILQCKGLSCGLFQIDNFVLRCKLELHDMTRTRPRQSRRKLPSLSLVEMSIFFTKFVRCWQEGLAFVRPREKIFCNIEITVGRKEILSKNWSKSSKSVLVIRPGPSDWCYRWRKTWLVQGSGTVGRRNRKKSWALRSESRSNDFAFYSRRRKITKTTKPGDWYY